MLDSKPYFHQYFNYISPQALELLGLILFVKKYFLFL
jgi:hypothetical protein